MKMASKKEDYLKNEDDLKNSDNLKNEDDLKIKTTSKIMSGGGLSFQAMFAAPNTSKSCIWHSSIANWHYSGSARLGPIVIIKLSQLASRAGALAWLSLAIREETSVYSSHTNQSAKTHQTTQNMKPNNNPTKHD